MEHVREVSISLQVDTTKRTIKKDSRSLSELVEFINELDPDISALDVFRMNNEDSLMFWVDEINGWCTRKGWNDHLDKRSFGDWCTLMHTEITEAYEEYRDGHPLTEIYYSSLADDTGGMVQAPLKPEGVPIEIADLLIRVLHLCAHLGLNPGALIAQKMAYNETRPYRHGGKVA